MFRPLEAETCRLIIKIPYISCNKSFSNSCLVFNLNYYKFVVLDVHTLLFNIQMDMLKIIGDIRDYANASKNCQCLGIRL